MSYVDHGAFAEAEAVAAPTERLAPPSVADRLAKMGPVYPALPSVAKHRRIKDPSPEQSRAYGEAVLAGIRELQRRELARRELARELPTIRVGCASGTTHSDGRKILAAIRSQHTAQLQRDAKADRARRSDADIIAQYHAAMAEKREREAAIVATGATERFLERLDDEAREHAEAGTVNPRAAEREAWDEAQAAEIEREEAPEASVVAPLPSVAVRAKRTRKPRAAKPERALQDARDEAGALSLPRSQAEWRALSSRLRSLHRSMPKREQGCTTLCVGPDSKRQIRYAGYPGVSIYNGASPIGDLLHMTWLRRRHVEGDYGSRLAESRQFAARSRETGPVPLPDAGRPYVVKPRIRVKAWTRPHVPSRGPIDEKMPISASVAPIAAQPGPTSAPIRQPGVAAASGPFARMLEHIRAERRAMVAPRKPLARTIVVADPPIAMPAFMVPGGSVIAFQRRA